VSQNHEELAKIQPHVAGLRRSGATALDLAYVAAGRFDGCWDRDVHAWDLAAGVILIREAGGFVTDLAGRDDMLGRGDVVAGNENIHRELLREVGKVGNR
jgi:myo-inositol-1(or 4)-monophosphatase